MAATNKGGNQIFISYSHQDRSAMQLVRTVVKNMRVEYYRYVEESTLLQFPKFLPQPRGGARTSSLEPWVDEDIPYGADWVESIAKAIKRALAVVVLVPDAQSSQVGVECGMAAAQNKRILPVTRDHNHLARYNLGHYQAVPWPRSDENWTNSFATSLRKLAQASLSETGGIISYSDL